MVRITVRLDHTDVELMKEISKKRGEQISDFVRRSIKKELANLGFIGMDGRKALGMDG